MCVCVCVCVLFMAYITPKGGEKMIHQLNL